MHSDPSEVVGTIHLVPTMAELEAAVARNSMPAVFTILAIWQHAPRMLDGSGTISPGLTTSALLTAIHNSRADIVSLLLAVSSDDKFPVIEAIRVGSVKTLEAFLWNGWDIDRPIGDNEPSALGYVKDVISISTQYLTVSLSQICRTQQGLGDMVP